MAVSSASSSTHIRISGMASGLDTDSMVSSLMKAERIPLDKLKQKMQVTQWKQDDYRSIITKLGDFNKAYMDIANPSSNMRSQAQYKKFLVNVTNSAGTSSSNVSATGSINATTGSHTLTVTRLATGASEESVSNISASLKSGDVKNSLALNGKKMSVTIDGVTKELAFTSDVTITDQVSGDTFASQIQAKITDAFGLGLEDINNPGTYLPKVIVSYNDTDGKLIFNTSGGSSKLTFGTSGTDDTLTVLGITSGATNRINTSSTLKDLQQKLGVTGGLAFYDDNGTEKLKFSINNKEFVFTADTKLSTVLSTVSNDSIAKVNLSYDSIRDKFVLGSKQTGSGKNIQITNTWGNFFGATSVTGIDPNKAGFASNGVDALVTLDGQKLTRSNNTFIEAGVTYTLNKADAGNEQTISLTNDVSTVYNSIKTFVDKYNEMIDTIYNKISEEYDRDYQPLTDDQKSAMKDEDITKWQEKAKTGLLKNDSTLSSLLSNLRLAVVSSVPGVSTTLKKIGISSANYLDHGKLTIDETTLKDTLQNDPNTVMDIFSKQSVTYPDYSRKLDAKQQQTRHSEEGIVQRIYDIVQNNISIIMDPGKQKGYLIEKAGVTNDISNTSSILSKLISDEQEAIGKFEEKLSAKEEAYYKKFTAMETAMQKLHSQSSWLTSQLSAMNSSN